MTLEDDFQRELRREDEVARTHGYNTSYFRQMLDEFGGVETAKRLLARLEIQDGLMRLWELGLLGNSLEAVVLQERFRTLFTAAEIAEADRRLRELGFFDR